MAVAAGHPFVRSPDSALSRSDHDDTDEAFVHVFSDFSEILMSKLNAQRKTSSLCDVTVTTKDGRSFRAHKAVLAACSQYLESELMNLSEGKVDEKSEAEIQLGMISSQTFNTLLDLLYTSKLRLTNNNVAQVLSAAEALDLKQVSVICRKFLRSHITSKSVTKPGSKHGDSMYVFQDENNNAVRIHECYERGQSEDSTTSSSGVSSLSAESSEKQTEKQPCGRRLEQDNKTPHSPTCVRPVSLPDMPADRDSPVSVRPSSAPFLLLEHGKKESRQAYPTSYQEQHPSSPAELINVTSTERSTSTSFHGGTQSFPITPDNIWSSHNSLYSMKREASISQEKYSRSNFPDSTIEKNITKYSNSTLEPCINFDESGKLFGPRNFQRSQSLAEPPIAPFACHTLQLGHRRSYDCVFGNQPSYLDLNTAPIPGRKKAKSVDHPPTGLLSSAPGALQDHGNLQSPTSLWASLYMLRSQALTTAAGFLGNGANAARQTDSYAPMPNYTRKQVQQSKSLVACGLVFCKVCRLEFTSEWALSVHNHLCHRMSYFYHPMETLSIGYQQRGHNNKEANEQSHPIDFAMKALPLDSSVSAPVRTEQTANGNNKVLELANIPPENRTVHKCYHCKKEFESIFLLRKHKSMEHMKRPYRCHRCDSAFPNKAGLSVHLRSHTGERPYRCKICNKAFTQLGHVQRHQKVHTGEKPYQCPLCQARVRDKASMHYHILAHQGVKPFQCDQCDARFTKRSSLVKHKNVHTGSFLYQCPQCKASFREKASLSRHVRSQHKDPCFTVTSDLLSTKLNLNVQSSAPETCPAPLDVGASSSTDEVQVV